MERILVSACLLGAKVRYHGGDAASLHPTLHRWQEEGRLVTACPEVDGGLGTPRPPAEIVGRDAGRGVLAQIAFVRTAAGADVTDQFLAGASMALWVQQVETAARARGVTLLIQEARTPDDLAPAFDGLAKQRSQAVIVPANGLFQTERTRIVQLALAARLPTIMAYPEDVEVGGLASYGVDARENYRRAAAYVDKILKGAKPGDLPIEFPTKLILAINLKTARALGLEVPLHQLADEVIE